MPMESLLQHMESGAAHERDLVTQLTSAYRQADDASTASSAFVDVITSSMEQIETSMRTAKMSPLFAAESAKKATRGLETAESHKQQVAEHGNAVVSALRASGIGAIALARSASAEFSAAIDDSSTAAEIPQRAGAQAASIEDTAGRASRATAIFHGSKVGTHEEAAGLFSMVARELLGHAQEAKSIADAADSYIATWR